MQRARRMQRMGSSVRHVNSCIAALRLGAAAEEKPAAAANPSAAKASAGQARSLVAAVRLVSTDSDDLQGEATVSAVSAVQKDQIEAANSCV